MALERDALGIFILDGADIERLGARFLRRVAPEVLTSPVFTPVAEIALRLQAAGLCTFSFDEDLGSTVEGYKYLGRCDVRRKHILIDRSLQHDDPRFVFTLAHELGHLYLHQKVDLEALALGSEGITDSSRDLVTHRIEAARPRTLLEWQANRFAAAVLVPSQTLGMGLEAVQRTLGITRRLGSVWLDRQPATWRDYRRIVDGLSERFHVSRAVVRYRLQELGLVYHDASRQPTRVGDILGDALRDVYSQL